MPSPAFNELTSGTVDLIRLEADLYAEVQKSLQGLMRDVRVSLNKSDLEARLMATRLRAADGVRSEVATLISNTYEGVWASLSESLRGAAGVGRDQALEALARGLDSSGGLTAPSEARLLSLPERMRFKGSTIKAWLDGQASALTDRFLTTFGGSMAANDNLATMLSRLQGSGELGFRDGIFSASMREGRALVRSSVQSVANAGRQAVWRSNRNKIKYLQWVSILDGRTSAMCLARAGRLYTVDGSPVGHTLSWGGGPGFLHWGCRSYSVPVLGDDDLEQPEDYEDWLAEQPEEFQNEALGPRRAEMFRSGKLGFSDLVNVHGTRPLTIAQIKKRIGATGG